MYKTEQMIHDLCCLERRMGLHVLVDRHVFRLILAYMKGCPIIERKSRCVGHKIQSLMIHPDTNEIWMVSSPGLLFIADLVTLGEKSWRQVMMGYDYLANVVKLGPRLEALNKRLVMVGGGSMFESKVGKIIEFDDRGNVVTRWYITKVVTSVRVLAYHEKTDEVAIIAANDLASKLCSAIAVFGRKDQTMHYMVSIPQGYVWDLVWDAKTNEMYVSDCKLHRIYSFVCQPDDGKDGRVYRMKMVSIPENYRFRNWNAPGGLALVKNGRYLIISDDQNVQLVEYDTVTKTSRVIDLSSASGLQSIYAVTSHEYDSSDQLIFTDFYSATIHVVYNRTK